MAEQKKPIVQRLRWGEDILALTVFFLLAFLPAFETISRLFGEIGRASCRERV